MLRVRLGSTWKQDPRLRSALARGGSAAAEAALEAVDAVALEVDGVDVVAGRAEGPLVGSIEALADGVLRLLSGSGRAEVHFSEGEIELLLARRGGSALVTVVAMGRPARLLARDVEVDLAELAQATREAANALEVELRALQPTAGLAAAGSLSTLVRRLDQARAAPGPIAPPAAPVRRRAPQRKGAGPSCTFELHDDEGLLATYGGAGADLGSLLVPGQVTIRGLDERVVASVASPPFLALRDLVTFAGRLADAARRHERSAAGELAAPGRHATVRLEADLEAGTLQTGADTPSACPTLPLARAICEAAVDLCGVFTARNPWQEHNAWLTQLRGDATERMAHVQELIAGDVTAAEAYPLRRRRVPRALPRSPLGPGRMRRLRFRRSWSFDAGAPAGFGLTLADDVLVAVGARAAVGLDARSGREAWRRAGAAGAWEGAGTLFVADSTALAALDPATGRERWAFPLDALPQRTVRGVLRAAGGLAVVVGPGAACAVDPGARDVAWTFAPPAALELVGGAVSGFVLLGSDAGFLYALEAGTGRTAWRTRLPGPLAAPPALYGADCLALCRTDLGGSLLALDPATGRRRFEVTLDATPTGGVVPFAGLLGVAGSVAGDLVVAAVDPAGALAWEDVPPLGAGAAALAPLRSGVLATTADGACVALDRAGDPRWSRAPAHPVPPVDCAPPIVARGVALVASEQVDALDVRTGALLGHAPIHAPVRLLSDAALRAWGMDGDGVVTAVRLETHLSVL
jgi:outer membrane protein assembly factor BamB